MIILSYIQNLLPNFKGCCDEGQHLRRQDPHENLEIFIESGRVGRNKDQSEQDIMTGYRDRAGHQAIIAHLLWDINHMDWFVL